MRKYSIFIILTFVLFQNKISAQGCSDYLTVEFDHLYRSICNESVGAIKITIENAGLNNTYYSSKAKTSLYVSYSYTTNIICGIHTYSGGGIINVNNTAPGEHTATFFYDSCMFYFNYTYRPRNPSNISFRLKNSVKQETIFNENDTIVISGGSSNADTYLWEVTDFNNFICDGSSESPPLDKAFETCKKDAFILEGLNITSEQKVTFTVDAHTDNLYCCNTNTNSIWVYPRRPKITKIHGIAPSCRGGEDGKIVIDSIDGALGQGSGQGSVSKYKITVAKGTCPNSNSGNLSDVIDNLGNNAVMPFADSDTSFIGYIFLSDLPLVLDVNSFYQNNGQGSYTNPIKGDSTYCILLENFYENTDNSGFANGCTFTEVKIPPKTALTGTVPNTTVNCNGDTNGKITLTVNGGNPQYSAKLFNSQNIMVDQVKEFGGQIPNVEAEYTFTGGGVLPADTYHIKLIDKNNCNVFVNGTDIGSDTIKNIIISQPDSLTLQISQIDSVLCKGANTGKFTLLAAGGNPIIGEKVLYYKYNIFKDSTNFIEEAKIIKDSTLTINNLEAATYKFQLIDTKGCKTKYKNFTTGDSSITVTEPEYKLIISDTTFSNYNEYEIDCHGNSTGKVTLTGYGGYPDYKYKNENDTVFSNDSTFNYLPAGTHKFYITDTSNGICLDSVTVTLTEPDTLIIDSIISNNYNGYNIRCYNYQDSIIVNAIGGVGAYQYNFNNTDTQSSNVLITNYGTKYIFIKDANNCIDSTTITLTQPLSLPTIDSVSTIKYNGYDVPCFGNSVAQITIHANDTTGTTTNGTFQYSLDSETNFQTDSVFLNYPAGIYHLKIKDANGCLSNALGDTIQITQPQLLQVSALSDTILNSPYNISCNGLSDGKIILSATGGIKNTYNFKFENETSNDTVTGLSAGTYSYFVTDANNCISEIKNIELTEPDALTFNIDTNAYYGNHAIRCYGLNDTLKVYPSGGFGSDMQNGFYKTNLNSLPDSIISFGKTYSYFIINANKNYKIIVTDANNCKDSLNSISFSQAPKLQILMQDTVPALCFNTTDGKLRAKWTGGTSSFSNTYDYCLMNSQSDIVQTHENVNKNDTVIFENLSPGTEYYTKIFDNNACTDSSSTTIITSPSVLKANITNIIHPQCFGDTLGTFTVTGTGGTANTTGIYDFYIKTSYGDSIFIDSVSTAIFQDVGTGTHNYFILDNNDCISDTATFDITEPDEITVSTTSQNVSAQGGSNGSATAIVQGGTNTYRYVWRNSNDEIIAENINIIQNIPAGDYSVEVWDSNNCPYGNSTTGLKQFVSVYEPGQALELYIVNQHNVSAPGKNDGSVSLDANGGWNTKTYKMGQNGIYTPANIFTELAQGNYWFYVTDGFSVDSVQTTITETEAVQFENISTQNITCNGNADGTATITVSGGTLPYLYSLNNIDFSENNTFENLEEGTYTVYVKDFYENEINQDFSISQPDELTVNISNSQNTSCGQSDGSALATANGGTIPYIYNWYLNGEHIGQYNAAAENLEAGLYTVTVSDANSCTASAQVTIYNSNGPEIENIITTDASCYNTADGSAVISNISASGLYTIEWSTGQTDIMNINNLEKGNYSVEVTDENNCSITEAFTINAPAELSFGFNTNSPDCYGGCNGSITANLSGGTTPYILQWQNINGNPATNYVGNLCAGDYSLQVTDANNCSYSGTANLENPEQISILEENEATICQGQSITLDAGNSGSTYIWTSDNGFQSTEQIVNINEAGNYNITVYTPIGCTAQDDFTLNFSESFLQANFLMQSEAEIADTVVLVEISWEAPDSVSWNIPSALWILTQSEENVQVVPTKNGTYTVALTAYLGSCSDYIEKQITITGSPDKGMQTKPDYTTDEIMQFKSVNLYPNPNNGNFTLDISLYEKDDIQVEVYDILGQIQQTHKTGKGEKDYTFEFNINNFKNGLYFISIKTNKGSAGIKFVKE